MGKYLKSRKEKSEWPQYLMLGKPSGVAVEFNWITDETVEVRGKCGGQVLYSRHAGAWNAVITRIGDRFFFVVDCPYDDCASGEAFPCTQDEHDKSNGIDRAYEMAQRIKEIHEYKNPEESWDDVPF